MVANPQQILALVQLAQNDPEKAAQLLAEAGIGPPSGSADAIGALSQLATGNPQDRQEVAAGVPIQQPSPTAPSSPEPIPQEPSLAPLRQVEDQPSFLSGVLGTGDVTPAPAGQVPDVINRPGDINIERPIQAGRELLQGSTDIFGPFTPLGTLGALIQGEPQAPELLPFPGQPPAPPTAATQAGVRGAPPTPQRELGRETVAGPTTTVPPTSFVPEAARGRSATEIAQGRAENARAGTAGGPAPAPEGGEQLAQFLAALSGVAAPPERPFLPPVRPPRNVNVSQNQLGILPLLLAGLGQGQQGPVPTLGQLIGGQ